MWGRKLGELQKMVGIKIKNLRREIGRVGNGNLWLDSFGISFSIRLFNGIDLCTKHKKMIFRFLMRQNIYYKQNNKKLMKVGRK